MLKKVRTNRTIDRCRRYLRLLSGKNPVRYLSPYERKRLYSFLLEISVECPTAALGRSACHSPGVYPSTAGFLPPSYHPHQHHPSQYHPHRGSSPHHQHGNHTMGPTMGPPHHHHHHQTQSLQHLHYRQPPTRKLLYLFPAFLSFFSFFLLFFPFSSSPWSTISPFPKKTIEYVEIVYVVLTKSLYLAIANVANIAVATFPGKLKFLISVEFLRKYRVRSRSTIYSEKLVSCDESPW